MESNYNADVEWIAVRPSNAVQTDVAIAEICPQRVGPTD
jgi:hypothetical protein